MQSVTLKPRPAPGSRFGTDASGNPNNGAVVNANGTVTVIADGTVIDGYLIPDTVIVEANNFTLKRSVISGGAWYGVDIHYDNVFSGTLIEDCEICGITRAGAYGIYGHDFTARRLNIHDIGDDAIQASGNNGTVLDCYFHDLGVSTPLSYGDGIQFTGSNGWIIRGNNFHLLSDATHDINSSIIMKSDFSPVSNILIDGNWLNGGNFTIQVNNGGHGIPTGIVVSNNLFGRDFRYGTHSMEGDVTWTNNRWEDTNQIIPL